MLLPSDLLERGRGLDNKAVDCRGCEVINTEFAASSRLIENGAGLFCFGDAVTLADVVPIPQMANARRFGARTDFPQLEAIEAATLTHPAFVASRLEAQMDAGPMLTFTPGGQCCRIADPGVYYAPPLAFDRRSCSARGRAYLQRQTRHKAARSLNHAADASADP
jgi:hypothetical protein